VQAWRDRGERSTVAVWTEHQLADFLRFVGTDRLYGMWWRIALRGLRRGEAAGLRWVDVDLDERALTINQQRLAYGRTVTVGPPKTVASRRSVALDRVTVTVLRGHRRRQEKERALAGRVCSDTGYVFTTGTRPGAPARSRPTPSAPSSGSTRSRDPASPAAGRRLPGDAPTCGPDTHTA
jgi:integrase